MKMVDERTKIEKIHQRMNEFWMAMGNVSENAFKRFLKQLK